MTVGRRRVAGRSPMRRLGITNLEPQAPVVGPLHAVPGHHPLSPGTGTLIASACICSETTRGRSRSPANATRSATLDTAPNPAAAAPVQPRRRHPQRFEHRLGQVIGEVDPGLGFDRAGEHSEAEIGSRCAGCPAAPAPRRTASPVRRRGRAGDEPLRPAARPVCRGRRPLLDGHLSGAPPAAWSPGQPKGPMDVTPVREHPGRSGHRRGGGGNRPVGDQVKGTRHPRAAVSRLRSNT